MPAEERGARMTALRENLRANDLEQWSSNFLCALSGSRALDQPAAAEAGAD